MFAGVRTIMKKLITVTRPALTSSGSEPQAAKNPAAAKKPTVQVVQYVQTVQVVESFEGSENGIDPDVLAQGIVEDLEAAFDRSPNRSPVHY
jgi:hypothetical protein